MKLDEASLYVLLIVFVRCTAMFLSSPLFSASNIPTQIRVFTGLAFSGALAVIIKPEVGPVPPDLLSMSLAVVQDALIGLLIGGVMTALFSAAEMAGSLLDIQVGISTAEVLNPVQGISTTILSQFKFMLGMVIFLCINAHHFLIIALVDSFAGGAHSASLSLASLEPGVVNLIGMSLLVGVQIAAPTLAVTIVIDSAVALITKAVPQMQSFQVEIPAKLGFGLLAVGLSLPTLVYGVNSGTGYAFGFLEKLFVH